MISNSFVSSLNSRFICPWFGSPLMSTVAATARTSKSVQSSRSNNSGSCSVNHHAAKKTKWGDGTSGVTGWCIPLRGQPTVPTVTEQHGITGVVAVFHRQTAGPVQPTLSQGSGHHFSRTWDTEAQFRGVGPKPRPPGEQTSFTVINKGDVDWAWADQRVLVGVQGVGEERVWGDGGGGAASGFNRSVLKRRSNFIHYCQTMENKKCKKVCIDAHLLLCTVIKLWCKTVETFLVNFSLIRYLI